MALCRCTAHSMQHVAMCQRHMALCWCAFHATHDTASGQWIATSSSTKSSFKQERNKLRRNGMETVTYDFPCLHGHTRTWARIKVERKGGLVTGRRAPQLATFSGREEDSTKTWNTL
eukprot:486095-Pelagomonas_calceolata.AAC.2